MPKKPQASKGFFKVTAVFHAEGLTYELNKLQRESGKDMGVLVKQSARRLSVDLAIRSFPTRLGEGAGAILKDTRKVYPSRRRIANTLDAVKQDAGKVFYAIAKEDPRRANAYATALGVPVVPEKKVDNALVRQNVKFTASASGSRSSRVVTTPQPLHLIDNREKLETYTKRMSKRVGTAAGGWVEASKDFGRLRYDGNDANLPKFKRTRRPMKTGMGETATKGAQTICAATNLVDYSQYCISQQALLYAMGREVGNLRKQSAAVMQKKASRAIERANRKALTVS